MITHTGTQAQKHTHRHKSTHTQKHTKAHKKAHTHLTDTKAVIDHWPHDCSSCENYSTILVPHPITMLKGRCLTSVTEVVQWLISAVLN